MKKADSATSQPELFTDEYRALDTDALLNRLHSELRDRRATGSDDSHRLLHELRSHQIVLEMQNRELKESQHELELRRDQLALLYDRAPIGYVTLDINGRVLKANPHTLKLLRAFEDQVVSVPFAIWVSRQSRQTYFDHLSALFNATVQAPLAAELTLIDTDRAPRRVRVQSSSQPCDEREGRCAHLTLIDVSDAQRVREELEAERHLATSLLDTAQVLVMLLDDAGRLLRCNRFFERLTGYDFNQVRDHAWIELAVEAHERDRARQGFRATSQSSAWTLNMDFHTRDGGIRSIEWQNTRVSLPDGSDRSGVLCVGTDVTVMRVCQERALRNVHQLAHVGRLTLLHQLAGQLAHELNQPLTAIMGYGHTAKRALTQAPANAPAALETLDKILAQTERAAAIIRHLRRFAARHQPELAAVDLNACVSQALELTEIDQRHHGVSIETSLQAELPPISGDALLLEQVVVNLVRNAFEALTDRPEKQRQVFIRTSRQGQELELYLADNGPGIPDDQMERVFNGFYTTKTEGVGLGLAICRSVVEIHDGRLQCEKASSGGQAFRILLPVWAQDLPEAQD